MTTKTMGGVPEKLHTNFLSRFDINEDVQLDFFLSPKIPGCKIAAVKFDGGKVIYDVLVPIANVVEEESANKTSYIRIDNVDSICVVDANTVNS
jgi:hypothetical protein